MGAKPIETLTPAEARTQRTAANGGVSVMKCNGCRPRPTPRSPTQDMSYGRDPRETARIYRPAAGGTNLPVVLYAMAGWVIADVQTDDATPRFMARQLNAMVVSVGVPSRA